MYQPMDTDDPSRRPAGYGVSMTRDEQRRLIARVRSGQREAFRELVEAYKDRLFAYVWRMVRNHHEAEDICQAAFVRAYEALESYNENYAFSTWLYTIAYRLCLNHLRKRRAGAGSASLEVEPPRDPAPDAGQRLAGSEQARKLKERIWSAVDKLTPAQKTAVVLFYREGKSCNEIGRVLGIPAVTVKSHLHRARARLRELLGPQVASLWSDVQHDADAWAASS